MSLCREDCDGKQPSSSRLKLNHPSTEPAAFVPSHEGADLHDDDNDDQDQDHDTASDAEFYSDGDKRRPNKDKDEPASPISGHSDSDNSAVVFVGVQPTQHEARRSSRGHKRDQEKDKKGKVDKRHQRNDSPDNKDAGESTPPRPNTGSKHPRPPRVPTEPTAPTSTCRMVGGRPTVDPARPEHRQMVLPLLEGEPVIVCTSAESSKFVLGVVSKTVTDAKQGVLVNKLSDLPGKLRADISGPYAIENFMVVKHTDFLLYCGTRYCVFGPPSGSLMRDVSWGSAWLDLMGEVRYLEGGVIDNRDLWELKRLDVLEMKFLDTPVIPVLVLGFTVQEEKQWKCIGLFNFDKPETLSSDAELSKNICSTILPDLMKDFRGTVSVKVTSPVEFNMKSDPRVAAYHKGIEFVQRAFMKSPAWYPRQTWRTKYNSLYPMQMRALTGSKDTSAPKVCAQCEEANKKLSKANVSGSSFFSFSSMQVIDLIRVCLVRV